MTERAQAWRNALLAGACFGLAFGLFISFMNGWLPPATARQMAAVATQIVVSGGIFALLVGLFTSSRIIPAAADIPLAPGDDIVHSGFANHFLNYEGRGGRLALTKSELVFVPHVVNLQRGELHIPRSEIAGVALGTHVRRRAQRPRRNAQVGQGRALRGQRSQRLGGQTRRRDNSSGGSQLTSGSTRGSALARSRSGARLAAPILPRPPSSLNTLPQIGMGPAPWAADAAAVGDHLGNVRGGKLAAGALADLGEVGRRRRHAGCGGAVAGRVGTVTAGAAILKQLLPVGHRSAPQRWCAPAMR